MVATIKRVDFYGQDSAKVTISDDTHECIVHCWPCKAVAGSIVTEPLGTLGAENIRLEGGVESGFEKLDTSYFAYRVTGCVIDACNAIVAVGDIKICVDHLPAGIQSGDMVSFDCPRIDLD